MIDRDQLFRRYNSDPPIPDGFVVAIGQTVHLNGIDLDDFDDDLTSDDYDEMAPSRAQSVLVNVNEDASRMALTIMAIWNMPLHATVSFDHDTAVEGLNSFRAELQERIDKPLNAALTRTFKRLTRGHRHVRLE